jgi:hypothetical protein
VLNTIYSETLIGFSTATPGASANHSRISALSCLDVNYRRSGDNLCELRDLNGYRITTYISDPLASVSFPRSVINTTDSINFLARGLTPLIVEVFEKQQEPRDHSAGAPERRSR